VSEVRFNAHSAQAVDSPWWALHVTRYKWALRHLSEGTVLDVACGSGYGTALLRERGINAIGLDIDSTAVSATVREAPALLGSGTLMPFRSHSFDAVVSFETIEHLEARDAFVDEIHRVIRPGGKLFLSTPNANYTRPVDGRPKNPHHVYEYTPAELHESIARRFASLEMLGQDLAPHVRVSPFIDDQVALPKTTKNLATLAAWRLLNKSPAAVRDTVSRRIWGHSLYLTDDDYLFESAYEHAPVLVVIASKNG